MKSGQLEKIEIVAVVRVDDVMVLIIELLILGEIMEGSLYVVYSCAGSCSLSAVCVVWKEEIAALTIKNP